jgi:hypothetical protein
MVYPLEGYLKQSTIFNVEIQSFCDIKYDELITLPEYGVYSNMGYFLC